MYQQTGLDSINITKTRTFLKANIGRVYSAFQRRRLMLIIKTTTITISIEYLSLARHCANCFPQINLIHLDKHLQDM